ncbi:MAG: M12 family metallo-peptidase [Dysgonamonadaceae bacterium]|jgi:hypothetical protein|nr:M12 family metallo-peptidase [Dysgonamonadaceae bacterium]
MKSVNVKKTLVSVLFVILGMSSVMTQNSGDWCSAPLFDESVHDKAQLRAENPTLTESFDPVTINVLIVYTPAAKQYAIQSGSDINTLIDAAIQRSNLAFSNSQTGVTINLAHRQEIDYTEMANPNDDLHILRDPQDGMADEAHALRTQHSADLVVMILGEATSSNVLGAGYIPTDEWGNAKSGFSVTRVKTLADGFTFTHELGHNFGCGHHTDVDNNSLYSYSHGYRGITKSARKFSTIMTYENTTGSYYPHVPYFSDPNIVFEGVAVGSTNTENAKTIRQFKAVIDKYAEEAKWIDAFLQAINISNGNLEPAFNPGIYNYRVNVPVSVTNIDIEGITNSPYAKIISGNETAKPLAEGDNIVEIVVEDGWGNYTKKYTVTVNRSNTADVNKITGYSGSINLSQNLAVAGKYVTLTADFDMNLLQNATIEIFDLQGNIISRTNVGGHETSVPVPYTKGIYLCVLKMKNNERYSIKMVVKTE